MDGRTTILPSRRFMCALCVCAVVHMPTVTVVDCWAYYVSREAARRSRCCVQPRWDGTPHAEVVNVIIVVRCSDRNGLVLFGMSSDSTVVIFLRLIAVERRFPKRILNPNHKTTSILPRRAPNHPVLPRHVVLFVPCWLVSTLRRQTFRSLHFCFSIGHQTDYSHYTDKIKTRHDNGEAALLMRSRATTEGATTTTTTKASKVSTSPCRTNHLRPSPSCLAASKSRP